MTTPSNRPPQGGAVPTTLRMRSGPAESNLKPVRARILWPALGFPAVVAPPEKPGTSPTDQGNATRTICVLIASDREFLSKEEAARYLRFVPWAQRGRRHIPVGQPGSFKEVDLVVRNYDKKLPFYQDRPKDRNSDLIMFGRNSDQEKGIAASLGKVVRQFYENQGLKFLNEIRVYEHALAGIKDGSYHLFWNNEKPNEQAPSDEMDLLLRAFAKPRRSKLSQLWQKQSTYLMNEYEYEYGSLHRPYSDSVGGQRTRTEILHPLFIGRRPSATMRVGQLTDLHVDVRADVYEENLKQAGVRVSYNNWNKSFVATYDAAKRESDVILLTGDLIDYGRGHWGISERNRLGEDGLYHEDRNWFLFYHLLASGNAYSRPAYTILGNHDWRLNPYPPMAIAGTPDAETMIHNSPTLTKAQKEDFLRKAHGPGSEPTVSYNRAVEDKYKIALKNAGTIAWQALRKVFGGEKTMDLPGLPTETNVDSVAWYLMAINPFLDYWFALPAGHQVLMLDWAEDENVFLGDIYQGKRYGSFDKNSGDEGPKAKNCLTDLQAALVKQFTHPDNPSLAKIIGIHAPPIGPWYDWNEAELAAGWKTFDIGGRGYPHYSAKRADGTTVKGHPLFAIRPAKGVVPDAVFGMDASWNSFEENRTPFINQVANGNVRLVLSGHIHRRGLFVAYKAGASMGSGVAGEMLIKSVAPNDARMVRRPAGALTKVQSNGTAPGVAPGPLYVNTTSVGPRGHFYPNKGEHHWMNPGYAHVELVNDGTIQQVIFRQVTMAAPVAAPPVAPTAPARKPVGAGRP